MDFLNYFLIIVRYFIKINNEVKKIILILLKLNKIKIIYYWQNKLLINDLGSKKNYFNFFKFNLKESVFFEKKKKKIKIGENCVFFINKKL